VELIDSEVIIGASMATSYVDENTVYMAHSLSNWRSVGDAVEILPPQTEIYVIEFNSEEVEFVASGVVPGTVRDSRMMDEYQGNLRVFSDVRDWIGGTASTDLYILRPNEGHLEIIGQLTDVADGQALYSAYFDEDQAMITTWVSEIPNQPIPWPSDPLHGFDLSDPTKPVELSELVIPGVSTYLQRVDAKHLVGVGYIDVGTVDWRQQISLYDVSDLANLKVVDTWTSLQSISPNFGGMNQNSLAVSFNPDSGLFSLASTALGTFSSSGLAVFKIDTADHDPLRFLGKVGDERAVALRSAVVGNSLLMISNVWLHTYSIDDLSVELDRVLLTAPGVDDWVHVAEKETVRLNIVGNDFITGGRVTAITSSKLGTVTILDDGASIEFQAQDIEDFWADEQLTYTVTLENGEIYSGTVHVNIFVPWLYYPNPVLDPITGDPVTVEPVTIDPYLPTIVKKATVIEGDISGDGELSPIDALLLVQYLNRQGERIVAGETLEALPGSNSMMDISGDGEISPIDALLLVGRLNASAALLASGEAPDDTSVATDNALLSLFASNYGDEEEIVRTRKRLAIG
jgi:hypothetical protein